MKRIIIYRVVAVAVLLMASSMARAEITGIKDEGECPLLIQNKTALLNALNNLSPTSPQASKYFQADKSRFVFCIDSDAAYDDYTAITAQTVLSNLSSYPVIIYGLKVKSTQSQPGQSLLTTTAGTGEIAFQNLTATGLRAPILLQGRTTVLNGSVSCDAANTAPAIEVSSDKNTFRKVTISDCDKGMEVSGNSNALYEVAIQKTAAAAEQVGAWGVTVAGKFNAFVQLITSGYEQGVKVDASYNRITSSTLGGSVAAVQIARGVLGIKLSQNTFTTVNTIAYADLEDAKARTLLSVEWMGKKVDETDPTLVTFVGGKILDGSNTADFVETVHKSHQETGSKNKPFVQCKVSVATEKISVHFKDASGSDIEKAILPGDKYFGCVFDPNAQEKVSTLDYLRFISNTPTVSLMSENVILQDFGDWPTIVAIALPSMPVGSELSGQQQTDSTGDSGGQFEKPEFDPAHPSDQEGQSDGNNATSGVVTLGDGPGGIGGIGDTGSAGLAASLTTGAGCSLTPVGLNPSQTASALIWLLALLPLPLLIPFRHSKRDDQ